MYDCLIWTDLLFCLHMPIHSEIYVTEIAILDDKNQVVAVGKPTYPIRKLSGKYLGFKLEVDF